MNSHKTTYRGVVKGIHEDYEDQSLVRLEIEKPMPKRKKRKGDAAPPDHAPRESLVVPKTFAANFSVGDRVSCETTVRRLRAVARKAHA